MEYTVGWGVGIATTLGVQQLGQLAEEINLRLFALLLHAVGRLSACLPACLPTYPPANSAQLIAYTRRPFMLQNMPLRFLLAFIFGYTCFLKHLHNKQ